MPNENVTEFIERIYQEAVRLSSTNDNLPLITPPVLSHLSEVISKSETAKGVYTVLLTSIIYKLLNPKQDIRRHQVSIKDGYSGRSFDSHYITPFLKRKRFPAMAESGWLTRSLEQKNPYTLDYSGAIKPQSLKRSFLFLIDYIEHSNEEDIKNLLLQSFILLIKRRELTNISLATPRNLNISQILKLLQDHWTSHYPVQGTARLPVLAIYAVYKCLLNEVKRFEGKQLLPLENHNSADRQSGRLGDIDLIDEQGLPFEAIEVKHQITLGLDNLHTAYEKFSPTHIKRYYILSTADIDPNSEQSINQKVNEIKNIHGCQVIVNGIYSSLKYYLRLLEDPADFIVEYVGLLQSDSTIKYEHKAKWNNLIENL